MVTAEDREQGGLDFVACLQLIYSFIQAIFCWAQVSNVFTPSGSQLGPTAPITSLTKVSPLFSIRAIPLPVANPAVSPRAHSKHYRPRSVSKGHRKNK